MKKDIQTVIQYHTSNLQLSDAAFEYLNTQSKSFMFEQSKMYLDLFSSGYSIKHSSGLISTPFTGIDSEYHKFITYNGEQLGAFSIDKITNKFDNVIDLNNFTDSIIISIDSEIDTCLLTKYFNGKTCIITLLKDVKLVKKLFKEKCIKEFNIKNINLPTVEF